MVSVRFTEGFCGNDDASWVKIRSVRIPIAEPFPKRQPEDLEVHGKRPVLQVIEVVFDAFRNRGIAAQAIHLCPAGNPRLQEMSHIITFDFLAKPVHEKRTFGSRPDQAHIPAKDIPELGELVQVGFAEKLSQRTAAVILGSRPKLVRAFLTLQPHGPKLVDGEWSPVESDPFL